MCVLPKNGSGSGRLPTEQIERWWNLSIRNDSFSHLTIYVALMLQVTSFLVRKCFFFFKNWKCIELVDLCLASISISCCRFLCEESSNGPCTDWARRAGDETATLIDCFDRWIGSGKTARNRENARKIVLIKWGGGGGKSIRSHAIIIPIPHSLSRIVQRQDASCCCLQSFVWRGRGAWERTQPSRPHSLARQFNHNYLTNRQTRKREREKSYMWCLYCK